MEKKPKAVIFYSRLTFLFILLFITHIVYSQNTCSINYIVLPTGGSFENNEDIKKFKTIDRFIGIDEALKKINYVLLIKNNESYFSILPSINLNDRLSKTAINLAGTRAFYKNNDQVIHIITLTSEIFNVLFKENHTWKLINETKIINNYLCFKAVKEKSIRNRASIEVIAWYCPKIPIPNGPKEFGQLPGLILELQDGRFTFLANKINLDKNQDFKIKKIEGKIILEEEYNKIFDDILIKTKYEMSK